MTRIRTIKPELPQSPTLGRCSRDARLLFVYLITQSDCAGNQRADPLLLSGALFPYDDDVTPELVSGWLGELESADCVELYTVSGQHYVHLVRWSVHQKIHKASASTIPLPPAETQIPAEIRGNPRKSAADLDLDLDRDQYRPPAAEEVIHKQGSGPIGLVDPLPPDDITAKAAWVRALRETRREAL